MSSGKSFVTDKHLCGGNVLMLVITVTWILKFSSMKQMNNTAAFQRGEESQDILSRSLVNCSLVSYVYSTGAVYAYATSYKPHPNSLLLQPLWVKHLTAFHYCYMFYVPNQYIKFSRMKQNEQYCTPKGKESQDILSWSLCQLLTG